MKPQPTDKLDATTYVAVNGPAGDALLNDERIVRLHATGPTPACLSRVLGNGHALVLRGARHSNVPGLPVPSGRRRAAPARCLCRDARPGRWRATAVAGRMRAIVRRDDGCLVAQAMTARACVGNTGRIACSG